MLVCPGSDVDHVPTISGSKGQLPVALPMVENCTWWAGAAKLWFAIPLAGVTLAVMTQLLLIEPPHPMQKAPRKITARNKTDVFMQTSWPCSADFIPVPRPPQPLLFSARLASRGSVLCLRTLPCNQSVWLQTE